MGQLHQGFVVPGPGQTLRIRRQLSRAKLSHGQKLLGRDVVAFALSAFYVIILERITAAIQTAGVLWKILISVTDVW